MDQPEACLGNEYAMTVQLRKQRIFVLLTQQLEVNYRDRYGAQPVSLRLFLKGVRPSTWVIVSQPNDQSLISIAFHDDRLRKLHM